MKKTILILLACIAMGGVAQASPDGQSQQRIQNVATAAPSIQGEMGRISLTAGNSDAVFSVYSITGQLVRVVRLESNTHAAIELPKGFYIVKYNNQWSRKVIVR